MRLSTISEEGAKVFLSFVLFLFCFQTSVYANKNDDVLRQEQAKVLKGIVLDTQGEPIIGANVIIKNNPGSGVITGIDGDFSISVSSGTTLVISYIGYESEEFVVTEKENVKIVLKEDTQLLSEVVVTALGMSRDKKALGYAMTELKGDELLKSNVVNPINALQGKVAGVQINMGAAGPQSSQRILIRGNTSISGNNQPIFVIDGIIIENEVTKGTEKFDRDFGNDLKNLNSDDFESVSVLKGAAATALYGSRASNGVILITTKKGSKGEGLGISFSQTQQWEKIHSYPEMQNEFGMGTYPLWPLNDDKTENRNISAGRNYGPKYDYKPYTVAGIYESIHQPYPDNLKEMYQTSLYSNTNLAISGATDKSTYRLSMSYLDNKGLTPNNYFNRLSLSLNATHDISKIVSAETVFNYVNTYSKNPTYQGGDRSPIYDFSFSVPRDYDTKYWKKHYWSDARDGFNANDPFEYSATLFDFFENNQLQGEEVYRGMMGLNFNLTDWMKFTIKADMNRSYIKNENKTLATENSQFRGAGYSLSERKILQSKITAMLSANKRFEDFSLSGFVATERYDDERAYHNSQTNNGLRVPGVFELNNSVNPATTSAQSKVNQRRINSAFASINADWKGQVFLDITGRNDWSSTLRYLDGSGNVSYFYPSVGASWILTESFKYNMPQFISFAKLRASYAIVGKDTDPYLITDPGTYLYYNSQKDSYYNSGTYPYFKYANNNLGANDLKPEKQHALEAGFDLRFLKNRIGIDFAWYRTNTKNQILALPTSTETGVNYRIINAGNIQNQGVELMIDGTIVQTKDWLWDASINLTHNKNKIIELYPGVDKYQLLGGGMDTGAWATVGGSYGDIYSSYAYKRDANGNKLLNEAGGWIRSGTSEKIGSMQPDLLGGFTTDLTWKNISFGMVFDARFGGDVFSGSYNYGMSSGRLMSSLHGRTKEYGGLERKLPAPDGRTVYDGMIPDGVFVQGAKNADGKNLGGKSYQQAYEEGLVQPLSAYLYYANMFDWGNGIREASIQKLSWIALRQISLGWNIPNNWTRKFAVNNASLSFVVRNVGYLYNSLPDNIHPEGLQTALSSEYLEGGGAVHSRTYGVTVKFNL